MPKLSILFIALFCSLQLFAQKRDSCIVMKKDDKWVIPHTVKEGETVFAIARRYHVPPAMFAGANGLDYQTPLQKDVVLHVPLGAYNLLDSEPLNESEYRTLYYHVAAEDNLFNIGRYIGVQQRILQQWNHLPDNSITEGQTLMVGWLLYDNTSPGGFNPVEKPITNLSAKPETPAPQKPVAVTKPAVTKPVVQGTLQSTTKTLPDGTVVISFPKKDTTGADTIPEARKMYLSQTKNEEFVVEEKGTAVFFESASGLKSPYLYFGFHATAPKGTVIQVYNPGADKTVYVKVLGKIPGTKQYHNSILGINSRAKDSLSVTEDRVWCELKYAGKPVKKK